VSPREPASAPVKEGDILAGKYRVERILGSGGMGVVVAATHLKLGTHVAIKFLLPSQSEETEAVDRFLREARNAARIESEHVARVTDVATLESGAPYLVMELLRGTDLAALVKKGPVPIDAAVEYVLQACEAIAEAHAMGIVHRDLKPSNLFLTQRPDGTPLVKVLDFGISKALETARPSLIPGSVTEPNSSFGSPLYMSPEQIKSSGDVDHRTDIWALGVVLHELIAGGPPFKKSTLSALYISITLDPAPPLRSLRPETPESLEATVLRCLEKDVAQRVQSVVELARELANVAPPSAQLSIERITRIAGASPAATTSGPPSVDENAATVAAPEAGGVGVVGASGPRTGNPGPWGSTGRRSGRSPLPGWAIVVAGGAVLLSAGLVTLRRTAQPSVSIATDAAPPTRAVDLAVEAAPPATAPSAVAAPQDAAAPVSAAADGASPPVRAKPPPPPPVRRNGLDDRN